MTGLRKCATSSCLTTPRSEDNAMKKIKPTLEEILAAAEEKTGVTAERITAYGRPTVEVSRVKEAIFLAASRAGHSDREIAVLLKRPRATVTAMRRSATDHLQTDKVLSALVDSLAPLLPEPEPEPEPEPAPDHSTEIFGWRFTDEEHAEMHAACLRAARYMKRRCRHTARS